MYIKGLSLLISFFLKISNRKTPAVRKWNRTAGVMR